MTKVERTAPKKIWLVIGEDCPTDVDFKELVEVTWCEDKIDSNSIAYVRAAAKAEPAVPEGYKLVMVPQESTDEPDWDECKRQAEEVTGLKVEQHTFSILKREVRRWIASKEAEPAVATDAQEAAERFLEAPDVQDEGGINAYYSRELVLHCIESALSSDKPDSAKPAGEPCPVCKGAPQYNHELDTDEICATCGGSGAKPAGGPSDEEIIALYPHFKTIEPHRIIIDYLPFARAVLALRASPLAANPPGAGAQPPVDGAQDPLQGAVTHLMDMAPGLNAVQIAGRLMIADRRAKRLRDAALSAGKGEGEA